MIKICACFRARLDLRKGRRRRTVKDGLNWWLRKLLLNSHARKVHDACSKRVCRQALSDFAFFGVHYSGILVAIWTISIAFFRSNICLAPLNDRFPCCVFGPIDVRIATRLFLVV